MEAYKEIKTLEVVYDLNSALSLKLLKMGSTLGVLEEKLSTNLFDPHKTVNALIAS